MHELLGSHHLFSGKPAATLPDDALDLGFGGDMRRPACPLARGLFRDRLP